MKFQNNGAFQNPEPAAWLFTVCRNGALNVGRKERRMQYLDEKLIDAGEIDAGHTVTAFYDVVPAEASANAAARMPPLDSRQYGSNTTPSAQESNEMLTVKLRYKKPNDDKSELVKQRASSSPVRPLISKFPQRWRSLECCCTNPNSRETERSARCWSGRRKGNVLGAKSTGANTRLKLL